MTRRLSTDRSSPPFELSYQACVRGYRVIVYDEIGSTNAAAMDLARGGDAGRVWVVAKRQTHGRGRRGRLWASAPGNLYASLLLVDEVAVRDAPLFGFVAGVALAHALREYIGHDARLQLKWPNDLLFDGAKLAGILLEASELPGGRFACVVGIGVNCASVPAGLSNRVTALAEIGAGHKTAQNVFFDLSEEFLSSLDRLVGAGGFETIRTEWLGFAAGLGHTIRVETREGSVTGLFRTIDSSGRMILDCESGQRIIEAGDIWLDLPIDGTTL